MLAMLSSRRSSFSLQLLRHFSIRVPSLKKQSLIAQLLRGNGSPKLTKSTQTRNSAKATHFLQQGEASLRSVYQHPPLGLSVEFPGLESGRQQDNHLVEDVDFAKLSVRSKKESKEVQHSDGAKKLSLLSLREGNKAHHCEGETELPVLSVPSTKKGSKAHHSIGDIQVSVRAQTSSKRGEANCGDGKPFQIERRKVDPAKVSVQRQIAGEEGHHSHGPVVSKSGGKSLALQNRGASQKLCIPASKLCISPLRTGSSKEISILASQVGDKPGKCVTGKVSFTERDEEDDVQNTVKYTLFLMRSAVGSETSKQSKVKNFVEVYSVNVNQRITDSFLSDLQRKIELVSIESAPLTHVKALLMKREFLSASPKKLSEVLTVLKLFFESGDKACEILTVNTGIIRQPLERLQQRLKVLVEFEVDKATCYRIGTRSRLMTIQVEKYRSVLSFLKDLGLSAESRNRILYKFPNVMNYSVKTHMQPIVSFFESIEIARPTLLKLLESRPATLCASLDKNLRVMHKLCQRVGLSVMEFVEALKKLTIYNNNGYFLPYNFFREQGLSDEAVASMIKRNPDFLTLPVENLEAKLHFLLHTAKRDISEIVTHPTCLKYSLARRIIPRFKILEELDLPRQPSLTTLLFSKRYSPNCI